MNGLFKLNTGFRRSALVATLVFCICSYTLAGEDTPPDEPESPEFKPVAPLSTQKPAVQAEPNPEILGDQPIDRQLPPNTEPGVTEPPSRRSRVDERTDDPGENPRARRRATEEGLGNPGSAEEPSLKQRLRQRMQQVASDSNLSSAPDFGHGPSLPEVQTTAPPVTRVIEEPKRYFVREIRTKDNTTILQLRSISESNTESLREFANTTGVREFPSYGAGLGYIQERREALSSESQVSVSADGEGARPTTQSPILPPPLTQFSDKLAALGGLENNEENSSTGFLFNALRDSLKQGSISPLVAALSSPGGLKKALYELAGDQVGTLGLRTGADGSPEFVLVPIRERNGRRMGSEATAGAENHWQRRLASMEEIGMSFGLSLAQILGLSLLFALLLALAVGYWLHRLFFIPPPKKRKREEDDTDNEGEPIEARIIYDRKPLPKKREPEKKRLGMS